MMSTSTLLRAVTRPRFLVSVWPWRGIAYTGTTAVASGLLWLVLACLLVPLALAAGVLRTRQVSVGESGGGYIFVAAVLGLAGVGMLALAGPRLAVAVAGVERWRLRLAGDAPTSSRRSGGLYTDPATWRAAAYLLLLGLVVPVWLGVLALVGLLVVSTPFAVHYRLVSMDSVGSAIERAALGLVWFPSWST